jgi:sphinganine-1-phosphate aldolase
VVDQFIADLKECVGIAQANPSGKGNMVALYGTFSSSESPFVCNFDWPILGLGTSSVVGPALVGRLASEFLNALYIA